VPCGVCTAVLRAARWLGRQPDLFPAGDKAQHAVLALERHELFPPHGGEPDVEAVRAAIEGLRQSASEDGQYCRS